MSQSPFASSTSVSGAPETKTCPTCNRRFTEEAIFCPKDGTLLVSISTAGGKDPYLGREILGHIEIQALIGAGAMGRVYRAYQKGTDRDVAVKILHRDLAQNQDVVARFLREAKVSSRLSHPNIVQVLLAGQLDDGTMYLVMEHLDGISLQTALLAAGGMLPLARALRIVLQICEAVGHAHEAGVVHRDVKPENAMLVKRGDEHDFVKVLDFGIARLASPERTGQETQAGLVFGTARYISPEGARGEAVGPESDVYAIATVAYQALSGRTPFESDSSVSLLVSQIHDPAPPLRTVTRGNFVPPSIEAAIMKNLAKQRTARDTDAHQFGRALIDAALAAGFVEGDLLVRPAVARRSISPGGALLSPAYGSPVVPTPGPPRTEAQIGTPLPRRVAITLADEPSPAPVGSPPAPYASQPSDRSPPSQPEHGSILGASTDELRSVAGVPRRGRGWGFAILGLIVVLGGGAALGVKMGWIGGKAALTTQQKLDERIARAQAALDARHWDSPPGDNVLELTSALIADAPNETRTYAIRNAAADKIVREALEKKANRDLPESMRLLRLAAKLSPGDKGIEQETEEVEAELASDPSTAGLVTDGGHARFVAHIEIDDSKPYHPGDAVKLVAAINDGPGDGTATPRNADPKAHFAISGPGLSKPVQIDAKSDGSARYLASYTFAQSGTFKVRFFARPDGYPVNIDAQVKIVPAGGGSVIAPRPSTTASAPSTVPSGVGTHPTAKADAGTAPTGMGTIALTPDPVPLPAPPGPGAPPPPPLPIP